MLGRKLMWIAWPGFLAACVLHLVVFALVDPLELHWAGEPLPWTRQAVYAGAFFVFWAVAMASSALTALLGLPEQALNGRPADPAQDPEPADSRL